MAGYFTTFGGNLVLNWLLTTDSVTRPTAWYVALHTGDPGADGSANELDTGTDADYVRKSITFDTSTVKQSLNDAAVSWTAASGTAGYTITYVSLWDASTSGNCIFYALKPVSVVVTPSKVTTFAIGEVVAAFPSA